MEKCDKGHVMTVKLGQPYCRDCKVYGRCVRCNQPLMTHRDRPWCALCEANDRRALNVLRWFLQIFQWGLVLSMPVAVALIATLAPLDREEGGYTRNFYWVLLGPNMFLASCIGVVVGRIIVGVVDRSIRVPTGLTGWYEPAAMMRDWFLIALAFTLVFAPLLYASPSQPVLAFISRPADTELLWWQLRAPLMFAIFLGAIVVLALLRLINTDALLPDTRLRPIFMVMYAGLTVVAARWSGKYLMQLAEMQLPSVYFRVAMGAFLFTGIMTIGLAVASAVLSQHLREKVNLPIPVTIAMAGPSNVGKTVFLARAYTLLDQQPWHLASLIRTPESEAVLRPYIERIEIDRDWPPPTLDASEVPFGLEIGIQETVRFHWLDLAGRAFTAPKDPVYSGQYEHFMDHLHNADAVAFMVAADHLKSVDRFEKVRYSEMYKRLAREFYKRTAEHIGKGARPVPLAVIVTKGCLVTWQERVHCRLVAQGLADYWQHLAKESHLPKPATRVFITSAVVTPMPPEGEDDSPVPTQGPLESQATIESVLWLAAQVLRTNVGLMDSALGFLAGSRLQQEALRMEALATKCD